MKSKEPVQFYDFTERMTLERYEFNWPILVPLAFQMSEALGQ